MTKKATPLQIEAQQLIESLLAFEVDGSHAPDARRMIRDERLNVQVRAKNDPANLAPVIAEARRVLGMWANY